MKSKPDNNKVDQEYVFGGDSAMTVGFHSSRTAETHAFWFLPYLHPGMMLLDCGCASGSITVGLAKVVEPGQVTGIDTSEIEIERGRKRAGEAEISNIHFNVGDIRQLDFANNSFDAVFSHNVLEHIPECSSALQEMRRVLKPGGVIGIRDYDQGGCLFAPNNDIWEKVNAIYLPFWEEMGGHPRIGRHLGRILYEAGFVDVKMSASYEVYSDLKGRRFVAQSYIGGVAEAGFVKWVTELGKVKELDALIDALRTWQELPGAIHARSHCEVVGRKPG